MTFVLDYTLTGRVLDYDSLSNSRQYKFEITTESLSKIHNFDLHTKNISYPHVEPVFNISVILNGIHETINSIDEIKSITVSHTKKKTNLQKIIRESGIYWNKELKNSEKSLSKLEIIRNYELKYPTHGITQDRIKIIDNQIIEHKSIIYSIETEHCEIEYDETSYIESITLPYKKIGTMNSFEGYNNSFDNNDVEFSWYVLNNLHCISHPSIHQNKLTKVIKKNENITVGKTKIITKMCNNKRKIHDAATYHKYDSSNSCDNCGKYQIYRDQCTNCGYNIDK